MWKLTLRRLLLGGLTLLLVSALVYTLIRVMPGDAAVIEASSGGDPSSLQAVSDVNAFRRAYGLDRPIPVAYGAWLWDLLRGDLGVSLRQKRPVAHLVGEAIGPTLALSATSLLLAYILSIPLGIHCAHRAGSRSERLLTGLLYVLYSTPSYVIAILLILGFGVKLGWFPIFGMRSTDHEHLSSPARLLDLGFHMALPVTCMTAGMLAYLTRFVRGTVLEATRQDYVLAARARGLSEAAILWRHAFRNSLVPFVTQVGLSLPALLSGSVILERIFAWPGLGRLYFDALMYRDYPVIMALTMTYSVLVVAGTFLADLLYAVVDPRISSAP